MVPKGLENVEVNAPVCIIWGFVWLQNSYSHVILSSSNTKMANASTVTSSSSDSQGVRGSGNS